MAKMHTVPSALRGGVDVMLTRGVESIPRVDELPGGCVYEPKWDGFRMVAAHHEDRVQLASRRGRDLTAHFPDVAAALEHQVPRGVVLDGEAVAWSPSGRLDFSALLRRLTTSPRTVARLVAAQPAHYVAFDVLAVNGRDLRKAPWSERRAVLEDLAALWVPPMTLSPVTRDVDEARRWFDDLAPAGIEGLVVKGAKQPYRGGVREWIKVKRRSTIEVIAAAVIGPRSAPTVVVAGLPIDGELRIVGRTSPLSRAEARELAKHLRPPRGEHPWPVRVKSATVNGFGASRDPVDLTLVEPIAVEVSADVAWSGTAFRHLLRYLRPRADLSVDDVTAPAPVAAAGPDEEPAPLDGPLNSA